VKRLSGEKAIPFVCYFHVFYIGVVFCRKGYSSHCELDERSEGGSGCTWVK
jgi:hypothetical protein